MARRLASLLAFGGEKVSSNTNCDNCAYYDYDDEYETYVCIMNLDQDEMEKFVTFTFNSCPYYKAYNEYTMVKKQN